MLVNIISYRSNQLLQTSSNDGAICRMLDQYDRYLHRGETELFLSRDVLCRVPKWGSKNDFFFFFFKRSTELEMFNILQAYELKFGQNLGCRTENSVNS